MSTVANDPLLSGIPRQGIHRILVCRPNHRLGNMLLMTPLIAELERLYKGAEIDVVAEGPLAADVFATFFSVKNIYCLPRRGFKHPASFLGLLARIRRTQYDLIIDPCISSGFSRTLARICKGRYKLGFGEPDTSIGFTHLMPKGMAPQHMAQRPVALARWHAAPVQRDCPGFPTMDIRLTEGERACGKVVARELLADQLQARGSCAIGIFADATGSKRYPQAWWDSFLATLKEHAPHVAIVEIVPMHGRSMLASRWPSYYSSSIRRMAAVMAAMDLVISADCGVMHLATASQVPTMGMFCVTDANVYGPYDTRSGSLLTCDISAQEAAWQVMEAFADLFSAPEPPREEPALAPVRADEMALECLRVNPRYR